MMSLIYECEHCKSLIRHLLSERTKLIYFGGCHVCNRNTPFHFLREEKTQNKLDMVAPLEDPAKKTKPPSSLP